MSNNNTATTRHRIERISSAILFSDDDDDALSQIDMQTQYSTPQGSGKTAATTTKQDEIDTVSPMASPQGLYQPYYMPYTLNLSNQARALVLPSYPSNIDDDNGTSPYLLLANIPVQQLTLQERTRRRTGKYPCAFSIIETHTSAPSFLLQHYQVYFASLIQRLHVDLSILDYNYTRLKVFIGFYRDAFVRIFGSRHASETQFNLNESEYTYLLEFYLQLDVDLFYMKTCSFRGARPRSLIEGLFCQETPECRYTVKPCTQCALCVPIRLRFNSYQRYRFVNGYESILNCPAVCGTKNIIYALTCQCGHFDYVGETRGNLNDRLKSHHYHTCRLILETFMGEKNYMLLNGDKTMEMRKKDRMRLYEHPMRCPTAIQAFLDMHAHYWRFVPRTNDEAEREDNSRTASKRSTVKASTQQYIDAIPKPPSGYKFSQLQIEKQHEFFRMQLYKEKLNEHYDAYRAAIIAILPMDTTDLFRQLVHSMFITHSESKLNTMGHLFQNTSPVHAHEGAWCANLIHRLLA